MKRVPGRTALFGEIMIYRVFSNCVSTDPDGTLKSMRYYSFHHHNSNVCDPHHHFLLLIHYYYCFLALLVSLSLTSYVSFCTEIKSSYKHMVATALLATLRNIRWSSYSFYALRKAVSELSPPSQMLGRRGPVVWSPRSPDFSPADFYPWCSLKCVVCWERVNTRDEVWHLIQATATTIRHTPGIFLAY